MAYGCYKDLAKRTKSGTVLKDKAFKITTDPKYNDGERGLTSMVYKFFDKKSTGSVFKSITDQENADKLHKPIIENFKKPKVYSSFKNNIWRADLA